MVRLDKALVQNQIYSPPGDCVVDIYSAEKAKKPGNPELAEAAGKIRSKIEPSIADAFQRWTKDSDSTVSWDEEEKACSFLNSLFPEDKSIGAKCAYSKAQKSIAAKQYGQARDLYNQALILQPNWALALNGLGKVYMREDSPFHDESTAINLYQRAIQADPGFTWAFMNIGLYYRLKGDAQQGKDWLIKALATYPNKGSILKAVGDACSDLRDYRSALDYYQKALPQETDPANQEKIRASIQKVSAKLGP